MVRVDLEARLVAESLLDLGQCIAGQLDDGAARLAVGVVVEPIGRVVHGPAVPEVHVRHHAEALERIEGAVHGRAVDVGMDDADVGGDLVGGQVIAGVGDGGDDGPARRGDPHAARSQPVERGRDAVGCHDRAG